MKAYLIGGPEDMVCVILRSNEPVLRFIHTKAMPLPKSPATVDLSVMVEEVHYRKIYEDRRGRYSVFVYLDPE